MKRIKLGPNPTDIKFGYRKGICTETATSSEYYNSIVIFLFSKTVFIRLGRYDQ